MSFSDWFWGKSEEQGAYKSKKPVSLEEGQKLFNQAYRDRSDHSKHMDLIKRQKNTLMPGSEESYKYRNRYVGNKIVDRGAIEFDLDGVDAGKSMAILPKEVKRKLKLKSERLYRAYEDNYAGFLQATKFWEQLQKIKYEETKQSYHDLFIEKIVGCSAPMGNSNRLARYSDVINTAFYLAVKAKLCEPLADETPKKKMTPVKPVKTETKIKKESPKKSPVKKEESGGLLDALF